MFHNTTLFIAGLVFITSSIASAEDTKPSTPPKRFGACIKADSSTGEKSNKRALKILCEHTKSLGVIGGAEAVFYLDQEGVSTYRLPLSNAGECATLAREFTGSKNFKEDESFFNKPKEPLNGRNPIIIEKSCLGLELWCNVTVTRSTGGCTKDSGASTLSLSDLKSEHDKISSKLDPAAPKSKMRGFDTATAKNPTVTDSKDKGILERFFDSIDVFGGSTSPAGAAK